MDREMNKETIEGLTQLSADFGYAVATLEAFMTPNGITSDKIEEAIKRLSDAPKFISDIIGELSK